MYGPQPYSCSDWEQLGVLSDYYESPHERSNSSRYSVRRNAYRPSGELSDYYEPPHVRSNSSWYSARQNVYRPPRNAFNSGDQFAEQERPLRQPHCARQSPNLGWSSSESHQQPFLHAKNETCWDLPSQTLVEEEHCEYLGNMLLMDSKSETKVEEVCGVDASKSNATGVSISSIALLDEKHGVEEDRAVSHTYHQVSASKEIYWSYISDMNSILSTSLPLPAAALLSDVKCLHVPDGDFKCLHVPDAEIGIGFV
ncbi:hypothetical protein SASPL_141235 [Salvia splendens]|uniref:Uncharacterized protein n=1 Tax=Salvia splendens TaxID=180675 RepID=A0A8X8ZCL1_SALSN|nr:hypothetical protein SASPL_141235 [Salvia splendens]